MFPIAALRRRLAISARAAVRRLRKITARPPNLRTPYKHISRSATERRGMEGFEQRPCQASKSNRVKKASRLAGARLRLRDKKLGQALDRRSQQRFATCRWHRKASISAVDSGDLITTPAVRRAGAVRRCRVFAIAQHAAFVDCVFCGFSFPADKFFQVASAG
jgi:hypothetical protein